MTAPVITRADRDQLARLAAGGRITRRARSLAQGDKLRARVLVAIFDHLTAEPAAELSPLWLGPGVLVYPTPPDQQQPARPQPARPTRKTRRRRQPPPVPVSPGEVRQWAAERGIPCYPRGPVPRRLVAAYRQANPVARRRRTTQPKEQ